MGSDFNEQEKDGLYKAIFSRRDVRSHFTSEPIDDEIITKLKRGLGGHRSLDL